LVRGGGVTSGGWKTYGVDELDAGEVHVLVLELVENIRVVDALWLQIFVA
jgi:hypothetical protein